MGASLKLLNWSVNGGLICGGAQGWDGGYQGPSKADEDRIISCVDAVIAKAQDIGIKIDSCRDGLRLDFKKQKRQP